MQYDIIKIKEDIINLVNSAEYQELYSYYSQSSFFNILNISRKETVHSEFLAWLFNPKANHELDDYAIRKLLETLALIVNKFQKTNKENKFPLEIEDIIISGNYDIENVIVQREKNAGGSGFIDIHIELDIILQNEPLQLSLVIENKVKSREGDKQTTRYYEWSKKEYHKTIFVYLTPLSNAEFENLSEPECECKNYIQLNYQYIVDYIVKNTVGELVKDKTPKDVARLKIVDPACGSGSFLIGAYSYLLNWHHKYYVENDLEKNLKAKKLFKDGEGNYFLSTQEKKDILLNNIHGVDIDPQAVEVTKLSLALKMLEGENSETINTQYKLFADRILPDLSSNIKCGNSLIGSDYYSDKQISLLGDEEIIKVNAFDWDKEFPLVFRYGGFDAVIGNPPYIRIQGLQEDSPEQVPYLKSKYESAKNGNIDIYVMFLEKALQIMNKTGLHGYILPHKFFQADFGENVRSLIAKDKSIRRVVSFKEKQIFENATTYTCLFFMKKQGADIIEYSELDQQKNPEEYLKDLCFII